MTYNPRNITIIGSSGAIGSAFTDLFLTEYPNSNLYTFSQKGNNYIDYSSESSIAEAADLSSKDNPIDLVIVTNGMLHEEDLMPEKSLKDLSAKKFYRIFEVNTITPALIAKYFLPKLNKEKRSIFIVLSARVGSISDNKLGGWYSYRASKAALNMIIKNASIEIARKNKQAIIVGVHPGTVNSNLSKPFQEKIVSGKIFTPEYSAKKILEVIKNLSLEQTGKCFAWDGQEILP